MHGNERRREMLKRYSRHDRKESSGGVMLYGSKEHNERFHALLPSIQRQHNRFDHFSSRAASGVILKNDSLLPMTRHADSQLPPCSSELRKHTITVKAQNSLVTMKHFSLALFSLYVMTHICDTFAFVTNFDSTARASRSLGGHAAHSSLRTPPRRRRFLQPSLLLLSKNDNESDYRNRVYGVNAQRGPSITWTSHGGCHLGI